jgi:hypothetical protein
MPVLDPKFFQGCDPIPPDILTKLFVGGPTRVNEINAAQLGWDGKLAGAIVLQLSGQAWRFHLAGPTGRPACCHPSF